MNPSAVFQTDSTTSTGSSGLSVLIKSSNDIKKSSTKLRKIFEKGIYQKKTQLSVLKRYKKRLDNIQTQNDKKFSSKHRVKPKLPDIKKFAGGFLAPGTDPLKNIGALAAFNAIRKGAKGDVLGALGPALVFAGIAFGPSLLGRGIKSIFNRGGGVPNITRSGGGIAGRPDIRNPLRQRPKITESGGGRAGRLDIRNPLRARPTITQSLAESAPKPRSSVPKFGGIRAGILNVALAGWDYKNRKDAGQSNLQAGVGAGGALGGALIGAAIGSALFPGVGTLAGLLIGGLFSAVGAYVGGSIADKLTGVDKGPEGSGKEGSKGNLTFSKTLDRYEKVVDKFEKFSKSYVPSRVSSYVDGREPYSPIPLGQNEAYDAQVVQDATEFRRQFPLPAGTPNVSDTPYELQMRENTMLHAAGIGNDRTVENVHTDGSAHYSNTAIDIPVNNPTLGDRVAQFWRSRGYHVLWKVAGHYDHVHVQWNRISGGTSGVTGPFKGYIIVPGHAAGDGTAGEKELVKRLAKDAYDKIIRQNPNAPVRFMDVDSMFPDNNPGWENQKRWYESMERQGYQILEIHMDEPRGTGRGVIRSHRSQSEVANAWIRQGNYAYPMRHRSPTDNPNHPNPRMRPLAGPHRGVDLFELGRMKSGTYSQSEISALTAPFVSAVLAAVSSGRQQVSGGNANLNVASVGRSNAVPLNTTLPYQQQGPSQVYVQLPPQRRDPVVIYQQSSELGIEYSTMSGDAALNSFCKKILLNTLQ